MSFSNRFRVALVAGASIAALAALPAHAQEDPQDTAEAAASTELDELAAEDDTIVVTGSRIRRAAFADTLEPSTVVGEEFLEDRGTTNVADILNEIPSFGVPGNSPTGIQGQTDVGQNFVNFFGLGSQRTLTVVNGRRFVAANVPTNLNNAGSGLQVDLNVIPVGLIDRVETIAVGGAPTYGSDAIAGTVNVILKRDFEGIEMTGSYGISERGDVPEYRLSGVAGANFAEGRGNVTISVDYNRGGGLLVTDREDFAEAMSYQANPLNTGPDDGIPDQILISDPRVTFVTNSGLPSFFFGNPFIGEPLSSGNAAILQFSPTGDLVPFDAGERFGLVFSEGGDGVDLSEFSNLLTPFRRTLINGLAHYEVTPGVEPYVELYYANTRANDQINQAGYNTDFFAGSSAALSFDVTNPFLTDQARGVVQGNCDRLTAEALAAGDPDPFADGCNFLLSRTARSIAFGTNETSQNLYRIVAGVRGDFGLFDRDWEYDLSFNYGRTENFSRADGLNNRRVSFALDAFEVDAGTLADLAADDFYDDQTFNVARNGGVVMDVPTASLVAGDIVCGVEIDRPTPEVGSLPDESLDNDVETCVPLNYFGEANTTPEARRYVNVPFSTFGTIEQKIVEGYVTGELFDLWAGPVDIALGFQHREEEAAFTPDAAYQNGIGRSGIILPTAGAFDTNEFYGEINIPLISREMDFPVISSATAEGKARYVDNSRAGGDWTYTAGGRIGIFDDAVSFRGNYTRSIRSPGLVELFLPVSVSFQRANDPCDASLITGGPEPANRQANCAADAARLGFTGLNNFASTVINGTAQGQTGGNASLENEVAKSWTVGAIIAPDFIRGFTFAIDYINIDIENAVSNLALTQIMQACYDADPGSFPNEYCDRFSRISGSADPQRAFQVDNTFVAGFLNAGTRKFRAVNAQLNYNADLARLFRSESDWGRLAVSANVYRPITDEVSVTGFDLNEAVGQVGNPDWRGQLNLRWDRGPVGLLWQTQWVGAAVALTADSPESRDPAGVDDYFLFNAGAFFRPTENIEVQFNIENVFDQDQPLAANGLTNGSFAYDFIGRYFRTTARLRF